MSLNSVLVRNRRTAIPIVFCGLIFAAPSLASQIGDPPAAQEAEAKTSQAKKESTPKVVATKVPGPTAKECAFLDDPKKRRIMDGLLKYLLEGCGRSHELGRVSNESVEQQTETSKQAKAEATAEASKKGAEKLVGPDVSISDPTGDSGAEVTQNETSMAVSGTTGTICAAHNDSYHGITENTGFSGFARSTDGGASFVDQGAIGPGNSGDPALVWRKKDGKFYYAALSNGGLAVWRSDDDCQSFTSIGPIVNTGGDDKELMAVDNNESSSFYGRLYVHWTDFTNGGIFSTFSSDEGASWSTPVRISPGTGSVQGAWPTVAPNGDVYSSWVQFGSGTVSIEAVRSTDGGVSWNSLTNPLTNGASPEDSAATSNCFRAALNGNIRYLPSPQIAVGPNGDLHVVYSYDPDGAGADTIDVFYRRSTDNGATWLPEIRVNDDAGTNDQFFPTLTVGESNIVSITFYDRRNDPNNLLYEYFQATSPDGGASFLANVKISDVQSGVVLDTSLATCYHGDYDTHIQIAGAAVLQWSDDRRGNADTFSDVVALGTDFLVIPDAASETVCAPANGTVELDVLQFNSFGESVTLSANGWPAGLNAGFSANPVTPPGSSTLTISGTGAVAAGNYSLNVVGTSSPSAIVQDTDISLDVFTQNPAVPALTSPADDASNVDLTPSFSWAAAAQAASYRIQVATDSSFSNVVFQADVADPSAALTSALASSTEHFWRVRASNACGQTMFSPVFSFVTEALPGDCSPGFTVENLFLDDFESGAGSWTTGGNGTTWAIDTSSSQSGTQAFKGIDVNVTSDQYLISPELVLPANTMPLNLLFWTRHVMEPNGSNCYDGGVIEIKEVGAVDWTRLENEILLEPYDGQLAGGNPIGGSNAWCGTRDWTRFVVDLESFGGQTVQVRFRLATDTTVGADGWWIDDVSVSSCVNATDIFADGFESGNTNAWSRTQP